MTTRVDPVRDFTLVDRTPIDYLDFASPISGLGSKVGIDATVQVARRDDARMGTTDRDGRRRQAPRRRDLVIAGDRRRAVKALFRGSRPPGQPLW